jgi:alpha-N-arabinofuranosidase
MANIAQTVNVLQAMVLTDGPKMLLTPTYHVFEMYSVHQDATLVPAELTCADYELDGQKIPGISASCSKAKDGKLNLTLSNVNPATSAALAVELGGAGGRVTAARVLTADTMQAHNTFEKADAVKPAPFTAFKADGGVVTVELPAKSLVVLEIALD